jgi:hypothetical protein
LVTLTPFFAVVKSLAFEVERHKTAAYFRPLMKIELEFSTYFLGWGPTFCNCDAMEECPLIIRDRLRKIIKILLDITALSVPAFPLVGKLMEHFDVFFEKFAVVTRVIVDQPLQADNHIFCTCMKL